MAGEILPGQQLYSAAPFQVLNPSGMDAGESIRNITAVGEGNRTRQAEAARQESANAHDSAEREKDRMAAAQQGDENRNLQREMADKEAGLANKRMDLDEKHYRDSQY